MKKFEYETLYLSQIDVDPWSDQMDKMGRQGWELVSAMRDGNEDRDLYCVFKREMEK